MEDDSPSHAFARPAPPRIDFRAALNDDQYAAVTADPGPLLVLAGAGSGKTRTLTYRVAYLLSRGVRPGEILLLTFTNKAAREMLHRVEDLTGVMAREFWGGTFHHIGHKLLRYHHEAAGLAAHFTILDEGDADALRRDVVDRIDPAFFKDKTHPKPGPLGAIISLARNTRETIARTVARHFPQHEEITDRIATFAQAYRDEKRRQHVTDYDDLLELWLEMLEAHPELAAYYQRRFRHILVDEYQDTNALQAALIDRLAGAHHQVMAVGDDAQCIYTWRGASFENFMTFPDRHPGTRICKIEVNYRSSPEILELANGILAHQVEKRGFSKHLRAARPAGEKPCLVPTLDVREQAQFVALRLHALREEGRRLAEIAVLYRAHYQALELQLELSRIGFPYVITSGVRFFEQAHIRDLVGFLRVVHNASDTAAWNRIAVLLPKVGDKGAARLQALARETAAARKLDFTAALQHEQVVARVPREAQAEWPQFTQTLRDAAECARTRLPSETVQTAIDGWYGDYLRGAYANYQNRLDDLKSLVGFATQYDTLADLLAQVTLLSSETTERSTEAKQDAVRLTTVHQAKGLEFDVVFVLGLADGMFPLNRAVESGDVEEERRLFYVAVTRARDELYLVVPRMSERPPKLLPPSRFIDEIPESLYEKLRLPRLRSW